jgi:hypothetical protein
MLTLQLWPDVGAGVALLVAMTLSLLVATAWRYVPLDDFRRFQIAGVWAFVISMVIYWI